MVYNLSVSSLVDMVKLENSATGSWVGNGLILSIFLVVFLLLEKSAGTWKALLVSSFATLIMSIFFVAIGIASPVMFVIMSALTIAGIFLSRKGGSDVYA